MKNLGFRSVFCLVIVLLTLTAVISCGEPTPVTTTPVTTTPVTTTPEPTTTEGPQTGGIMRYIGPDFPKTPGYIPEQGPGDDMFGIMQRLCQWDANGNLVPILAESWEGDPEEMTITWHLRKGVKFTDGSDWNAEVLKWNYELRLENNKLTDGQYVESLEIVDTHTLKMHLTNYTWLMFRNYGGNIMASKEAFINAGPDDETRITWAREHPVGTGPFKVVEFQRDTLYKLARNENYWEPGKPYLDGIELRYIPDPMVAAAMMEAGEADIWVNVSAPQHIIALQGQGLKINQSPGMHYAILFDSNNPDSPFANQKVREAVEYAIDRPTLTQMLGQGLWEPLSQMSASISPAYIEGYNPRPFNPEKARQLLEEAGYSNRIHTTLLAMDTDRNAVAGIQSYLADVGITVDLDIADFGRYLGSLFGTGWTGLAYGISGIDPDGTELFAHFGPEPLTFKTNTMYKSPEFLAKCNAALDPSYNNVYDAIDKIREAARQGSEDAMIVPLWRNISVAILQPYVHSDYQTIHNSIWNPCNDWKENP